MLALAADENFNNDIVRALLRRKPNLNIVRLQDAGLSGADDPTVLRGPWGRNSHTPLFFARTDLVPSLCLHFSYGGRRVPFSTCHLCLKRKTSQRSLRACRIRLVESVRNVRPAKAFFWKRLALLMAYGNERFFMPLGLCRVERVYPRWSQSSNHPLKGNLGPEPLSRNIYPTFEPLRLVAFRFSLFECSTE